MKSAKVLALVLGCFPVFGPAAAVVADGKPIVVAWEAGPRSFDPRYSVDANSQYLDDLLHCSLIGFGPDGDIRPELATAWTWTTPTALSVDLKAGVLFADGSKVTAEDVKATYEFFLQDKVAVPTPRAGAFRNVIGIKAEATKVTFTLKEPDASFVSNLVIGILPGAVAKGDLLQPEMRVVGCGPYVLNKTSVSGLELAVNPHFSLGATPKGPVEIKIVKEESTRFAKLLTGEVDIVQNAINVEKLRELEKKYGSKLSLLKRPGLKTGYLGFNTQDKILKDVRVRKAIALAIDRNALITYILHGMATPAQTILPATSPYFDKTLKPITQDLAAAAQLLDEAGYKLAPGSKTRFALSYKTTTDPTRIAIGKAIAQDLSRIGISLDVQSLEWGRFKDDVDKGLVQMWSLTWIGFKDPDIYRYAFATSSFPPDGGNRGRFSDPQLDGLLTQARAATKLEDRVNAYHKIQQIVQEQAPYVFLFHEESYAVVNKAVQGFEVYADGRYSSLRTATK